MCPLTGRRSSGKLGEYRNLQLMPGRIDLWQFQVKTKAGWKLLTNLGGDNENDRKEFAQKTADDWIKK